MASVRRSARRARQERTSIWDRCPRIVSIPLFAAVIVAAWQLVAWRGWASDIVLPNPASVGLRVVDVTKDIVSGGTTWEAFATTLKETLLALLLAAIAGVGLGAIGAETAFGRRVLLPFLVSLNAAPKVAFAPILVAWLGFGIWPKIVMGAIIAFFPLLVDTATGLASIDATQEKLFRSLRATRLQTLMKLKFYNALPFIFAGLKTASILAVIGAVVGEFLAGSAGLGALISVSSANLAMDYVYAYVLVLSALGYLLYVGIAMIERHAIFWRKATHLEARRASER